MNDLRLARTINVVAVGTLALGVVACGSVERRAARKWCKAQQECDKDYFEDKYDSDMQTCIEDELENWEEFAEEEGKECANAYAEYYLCYSRLYLEDCDSREAWDECEDEGDAMDDICD